MRISLLLTLLLFCISAFSIPAQIIHLRISRQNNQSRFVFETDKKVNYKYFFLLHPNRFVIDINNAQSKIKLNSYPVSLKETPVQDIRGFQHNSDYLRIVLDLKHEVKASVFTLNDPNRLVVDLMDVSSHASSLNYSAPKPVMIMHQHDIPRNIVIVIDPGHGGKDPGAPGPGGHHEKTVVLAIAKDLYQIINHEPGFTAKLTRTGDYYVTLWGRLKIARKDHADMFIAIHADALNRYARGASVYALSERGATSAAARWLAERENRSELMGGVNLGDKDSSLRSVLISLSQNHTIAVSLQIGLAILRQLSQYTTLHNDHVDQAAFVVLKSPDIPSLLVETGFISNPNEERRLMTSRYQKKIANALALGIEDYFKRYSPRR